MTSQGAYAAGRTRPGSGIASRYRALLMTHGSLDEKLEAEMKRPLPDTATLSRIKRRKLTIKDELAAIERLFDAMGLSADATGIAADEEGRLPASPGARRHGRDAARPRQLVSRTPIASRAL